MPEPSYHKGDLVQFRLGIRVVQGIVKEDRGPIGIKGRHLYLVEFLPESRGDTLARVELPAAELQPIQEAVVKK